MLVFLLVISGGTLQAQEVEGEDKLKFLDDALEALERAKRRQLLEDSSKKVDEKGGLVNGLREKAEAAAKNRKDLPKLDEASLGSRAKAEAMIKRATPEARRLIASARAKSGTDKEPEITTANLVVAPKSTGTDSQSAPGVPENLADAPPAQPLEAPTIGGVPVPVPDTAPDVLLNQKLKEENEKMRITCSGTSFYDKSGNVILFEDKVVAKHPGFLIQCEEMEVFLEDGAIAPGASAPTKPTAGRDSAGIRRAVAKGKGKQIDLVRYTPKGELVGKCGLVNFDGRTGDIELRDWPVVSNGKFTRRAATKDAVIIIRQNGEHQTTGKFLDDFDKPEE